jgi:chromate transporter
MTDDGPASHDSEAGRPLPAAAVSLATISREWGRIGCIGFGGPPTHIALLRRVCVEQRHWLPPQEFEDGIAATNLLPGPASTQLAIFCAWRLRGVPGALVGGLSFILPGLIAILILSSIFLADNPPVWVLGAAAGAGAAVPAVALRAASGLIPASRRRLGTRRSAHARWLGYALLGGASAALIGPYLVLVLIGCGLAEISLRNALPSRPRTLPAIVPVLFGQTIAIGWIVPLIWVAFKVGALSYGGGFVIVPLMQHDAVTTYHFMTASQFLNAVALGQLTPGPVVQTVAVVGYAAGGLAGGLLAAFVAFTPSFLFVLVGGPRFDQLRKSASVQSFLTGAGPAVIGAIAGSAIPLGMLLHQPWQVVVALSALAWLFVVRRGVVSALLLAGIAGVGFALWGLPV